MERTFIDTNVLIYADDLDAGVKRERARSVVVALTAAQSAVVSTQVLQEYFVAATRKLGMAAEVAHQRVKAFAQLSVVLLAPDLILSAIDLHRLRSISFWDALIVRAAADSGCTRLLSEDLQHGQSIEGVRIENPFVAKAVR
jgi:predicted nucleic acid-binding protein